MRVLEAARVDGCSVAGCGRPFRAKGYCGRHYAQSRLYGDVLPATKFDPRPAMTDGDLALVPIGINAKNGYATVDAEDAWVDKFSWSDDGHGYAVANKPGGGMVSMHRLLLGFPDCLVDHRDGDPRNNRRSNLRAASFAGNARNQKLRRNSRTGYKGVSFDVQTGRYRAFIGIDGKTKHLGRYDTAAAAAVAYDKAATQAFGAFAKTNGIVGPTL